MSDKPEVIEFQQEPQEDVIETLEEILKRARAGELRAVAIAAQCDRLNTATAYALGDGDVANLVYAIESLKLRLLRPDWTEED